MERRVVLERLDLKEILVLWGYKESQENLGMMDHVELKESKESLEHTDLKVQRDHKE